MVGVWIVVGVLVAATVFGLWNRRTEGRIKDSAPAGIEKAKEGEPLADIEPDDDAAPDSLLTTTLAGRMGEKATVLQFSSAFCQPCRATRRILEEVATMVPGVAHVEIDAEENLELVRELGVMRTPTVIFLDARGVRRKHASGLPRKADVIAALGEIIPEGDPDFTI